MTISEMVLAILETMPQAKLAKLLGVSQPTVHRMLYGSRDKHSDLSEKLSAILAEIQSSEVEPSPPSAG
jgi:predicted transcriptional regulator